MPKIDSVVKWLELAWSTIQSTKLTDSTKFSIIEHTVSLYIKQDDMVATLVKGLMTYQKRDLNISSNGVAVLGKKSS